MAPKKGTSKKRKKKDKNAAHSSSADSQERSSGRYDFSQLRLKADHENRPIWVCPDGRIFLETFSALYTRACDFLVAIAEPVCRPEFIHEYKISEYSLYAAASVGLGTRDILEGLHRLSKVHLEPTLEEFIRDRTSKCGKVKMLLKKGQFFVESIFPECLERLLGHPDISSARVAGQTTFIREKAPELGEVLIPREGKDQATFNQRAAMGIDDVEEEVSAPKEVLSFEIDAEKQETVKHTAQQLGYPMLEEYAFREDNDTKDLPIMLKSHANIRPYQEKSLSKMFGNGRARSGIIVLPCGAGKTLVGITATSTVKKSTLIFANTATSCNQWKQQVLYWTNIKPDLVCEFTAETKDKLPADEACVLVSTYNMVAFTGKRSAAAEAMMKEITSREWGLIILDEVHVAPARMFRRCVNLTKSRCKLGLTATLLREDDLINDLYYLIGPKLYEANWLDLQNGGYLATVQCIEVWCPMPAKFYEAYVDPTNTHAKQRLLYTMNPNKFRSCEYLIRLHEARGDKTMVFSDNLFSLQRFAKKMHKFFICGATPEEERRRILAQFQNTSNTNVIFISKVGDTSLDLPDVNVIIQISSHFASRRQEAQRLGRILRPKERTGNEYNAYFYTLVSKDTQEMKYATKRQRFLVDQGYSFHVVTELVPEDAPGLSYSTNRDRMELLAAVLSTDDKEAAEENMKDDDEEMSRKERIKENRKLKAKRRKVNMAALAGADTLAYEEFDARQTTRKKASGSRSKLFAARAKQKKQTRRELRLAQAAFDAQQ